MAPDPAAALTPSQTVGPFHHIELPVPGGGHVVAPDSPGSLRIAGRVIDGDGRPVDDALIEVWQADPSGHHGGDGDGAGTGPRPDDGFTGFGRIATTGDGSYELWTVKPGSVPGPGGTMQAPHLVLSLFARGLLDRLVTRMYFPDEEAANATDPVLGLVADPGRRSTLVAAADSGGGLRFDIHLQGPEETVFFAV